MATEIERAYAAGFFDGEGTVTIRTELRKTCKTHVLQIAIGITDRAPLEWMSERFGGNIRGPVIRASERHKPIYFWQLSAAKAGTFLEEVRPYLLLKAKQADIALELRRIKGSQGVRPSDEQIAARDALKEALTVLNHRGLPLDRSHSELKNQQQPLRS